MRFGPPPSFKFIGAESVNTTMSSPRFNARGRNPWRRGFCHRPPPDDCVGGAFVSGDSHLRSVRDANYGFRQGYPGDAWNPQGAPRQQFRTWPPPRFRPPPPHFGPPPPHFPHTPHFRPPPPHFRPPPRPADFRDWNYSLSQPPPQCERFMVLSYNILADYLARDHRSKLYFHIPHHILDWDWRKRRLLIEFGLWDPDIMCLQEVDRFHDLEEELAVRGYSGIWKMRTGNAVDGCAVFWRTNRFHLRHEEYIEFNKLGLRDNVAQICVLESRIQNPVENASASLSVSSDQSTGANQIVVCNIHVLYNPKRGEIKLGQVRMLLDHAHAVSRVWNDAPVIVCGDFNSTPKSPLYNFISGQELSLSGLARDQISGQYSANIYGPRPYVGSGLYSGQPFVGNSTEVAVGKQGSCYLGSYNHYTPHSNIQNASLTEKLPCDDQDPIPTPQRSNGMLDISMRSSLDSQYIIRNDTVYNVNAKEEGEAGIVDGCCSESSSTWCNESINNHDLGSSSRNHESSQKSTDHSGEGKNSSKLFMGFPDVSTKRENLTGPNHEENINSIWNPSFRGGTEGFPSNMNSKEAVVAEAPLDKLRYDAVTEISSDKFFSETFPAKVEESTLQGSGNISADLISEQNDNLGIELSSEECSQSLEKSASLGGLQSNLLEDPVSVCQAVRAINGLCSPEENSDPNFFIELRGTEDQRKEWEETRTMASSGQIQSSSVSMHESQGSNSHFSSVEFREDFSPHIGPYTTDLEKRYYNEYNPFLWTPAEIETASGSAECTFIKHNLKLRSAYADVEDYAGTKDSSREPEVTSYNRQFMGTVDYIWCSEGLQTVKVLNTIPKHVLRRTPGFPTQKWGSDHIALACQLAFTKGLPTK